LPVGRYYTLLAWYLKDTIYDALKKKNLHGCPRLIIQFILMMMHLCLQAMNLKKKTLELTLIEMNRFLVTYKWKKLTQLYIKSM